MFELLSDGFANARMKLQGKAQLTEDNMSEALREVRSSLLQADVELSVARDFITNVKEQALGDVVQLREKKGKKRKVSPADYFVKACYDQLVELMGPVDTSLDLSGQPSVIMLVGLQGSGKTTTAAKLTHKLQEEGKKVLLVAGDVYRPAAVDQLRVLGDKLGAPVFSITGVDPVQLSRLSIGRAMELDCDVVIIDTAGRLAIDETLMAELDGIKAAVRPQNVLFVCDAMMGQDAVHTAAEFDRRLDFGGFILTKLDGDARGGAALSIKAVTGKPIKFLGAGEDLDRLEVFRPEGLAQRILGLGDVVGLMQDFEKHVDQEQAEQDAKKMLKGSFSYDDFIKQIKTIRKMGSLRDLMGKMPFMADMMKQIPEEAFDDQEMDRTLAIMGSMTKQERSHPEILSDSRFRRIARGCGRTLEDVRELHDRFLQAREMMKGLGSMMGGGMPPMGGAAGGMLGGGMPGFGGGFPGMGGGQPRNVLSSEDKIARRKKQKAARKARKKNRR